MDTQTKATLAQLLADAYLEIEELQTQSEQLSHSLRYADRRLVAEQGETTRLQDIVEAGDREFERLAELNECLFDVAIAVVKSLEHVAQCPLCGEPVSQVHTESALEHRDTCPLKYDILTVVLQEAKAREDL